jgi:hypothetical protein
MQKQPAEGTSNKAAMPWLRSDEMLQKLQLTVVSGRNAANIDVAPPNRHWQASWQNSMSFMPLRGSKPPSA